MKNLTHGVRSLESLRSRLDQLSPTGSEGFEGLVCRFVEELTGRKFYLASSGTQGGRDLSTGGLGPSLLAVEAKKYGGQTKLNKDRLVGKLTDAILSEMKPDLWVLATTQEVPDQLVRALVKVGVAHEVGIELLSKGSNGISDVELLCCYLPDASSGILACSKTSLVELQEHFPGGQRRVDEIRSNLGQLSYSIRQCLPKVLNWYGRVLDSEAESKRHLGCSVRKEKSSGSIVTRDIEACIASWWRARCSQVHERALVVQGEEGVGKTFLLVDWLRRQVEEGLDVVPVFLSASSISSSDPMILISSFLSKALPVHTPAYWEERVRVWLNSNHLIFVLFLDGINERPSFARWRKLLDNLQGEPFLSCVATVVSVRSAYWKRYEFLGDDKFDSCKVEEYTEGELQEALALRGLSPNEFTDKVRRWLRRPRYLSLVLKHRDALSSYGEITVDRILYEDWRDRMSRKRSLGLSNSDFRLFIKNLADNYDPESSILRADVVKTLKETGVYSEEDLEELLTGGLFELRRTPIDSYVIEPYWLRHALGLALAFQLGEKWSGAEEEIEEELDSFFATDLNIERESEILAAAALYGLQAKEYPVLPLLRLLARWLCHQNHSQGSYDSLVAYAPLGIDRYLRVLEMLTYSRRRDYRAIELLENALLWWRGLPAVRGRLAASAKKWLSLINPDSFSFVRRPESEGEYSINLPLVEEQRRILKEARQALSSGGRLELIQEHRVVDEDGFSRLACSGLLFLSALPFEEDISPYLGWVASRAVMGATVEWEAVRLLLRINLSEEIEASVLHQLEPFFSDPREIIRKAGADFLLCLGTANAHERLLELPEAERATTSKRGWLYNDPLYRWISGWEPRRTSEALYMYDLDDMRFAQGVATYASEPTFLPFPIVVERVEKAIKGLEKANVWAGRMAYTGGDHDLDRIEPAVAALLPEELSRFYKNLVIERASDDELWADVSIHFAEVEILLGAADVHDLLLARWREACAQLGQDEDGSGSRQAELMYFRVVCQGLSAQEQISVFQERPTSAIDDRSLCHRVKEFDESQVGYIVDRVAGDLVAGQSWLAHLLIYSSVSLTDGQVARLIDSYEGSSDNEYKGMVALAVQKSASPEQLRYLVDGDRLADHEFQVFRRSGWLCGNLLHCTSSLPYSDLKRRVGIETASYVLEASERWGEDLALFTADFDAMVRQAPVSNKRFQEQVDFSVPYVERMLKHVQDEDEGDLLDSWVELCVGDLKAGQWGVEGNVLWIASLAEAMLRISHPRALEVYYSVCPSDNRSVERMMIDVAFCVEGQATVEARSFWVNRCKTDLDIATFVSCARSAGKASYVSSLIEGLSESSSYWERAKAVSACGWFANEALLKRVSEKVICLGAWGENLIIEAEWRIGQETKARHWLGVYFSEADDVRAFPALRLFLHHIAPCYWGWLWEFIRKLPQDSAQFEHRYRFLVVALDRRKNKITSAGKKLQEKFLCLALPKGQRLIPWSDLPARSVS